MTEDMARHVFRQICHGLKHMHSLGYCHLDLKLENILVQKPDLKIKLGDFGVSVKDYGVGYLTSKTIGTKAYNAPEIRQGAYKGRPVDIFALGVILFLMCTGYHPFTDSTSEQYECL